MCYGIAIPGWSSLALLDPGLISVIPAGIKKLIESVSPD
jgi:hypothetical protein